jgi:oxygen-dependent protoporphyrinogen oxidase
MSIRSIAVVGGGAAGMAAAYYLRRDGHRVEVIERDDRLGGRMATAMLGRRSIALGGKNIGRRYTLFREFVREMGDQPFEHFGLNSSRIRDGRVVTFDGERRLAGMLRLLRTCSARDILRAGAMAAAVRRDRRNAFLGGPFFAGLARKHPADCVAGYFSRRFCEQVVRPMSVRMNGAEPGEIALGNFGTNLCMIFDTYDQLRDGLEPLFETFSASGPLRLGTTVDSLVVHGGRVAGLRLRGRHGLEERRYDDVVLAVPAPQAAALVRPHAPQLGSLLDEVRYFPVGVVVAEYARPVFGPAMRALVFPPDEALSNAGVYGIDDRHIVRYTFSGAAARPLLAGAMGAAELLERGERALTRYVPVAGRERVAFVGRVMSTGLCAYARDQAGFVAGLERELPRLGGLELTGDYLQGASIEACFRASLATAARLSAR